VNTPWIATLSDGATLGPYETDFSAIIAVSDHLGISAPGLVGKEEIFVYPTREDTRGDMGRSAYLAKIQRVR
jgi:hypothetical protein